MLPTAVIVNAVAILINSVCLYVLVSHVNRERVGLDVRYVKKALDEFSTGRKIWPGTEPFNIFALLTWNLQTSLRIFFFQLFFHLPMRRALLHVKSSMASPSWVTTHSCNHGLATQKFRWLWCSHLLIFLISNVWTVRRSNFRTVSVFPCEWNT